MNNKFKEIPFNKTPRHINSMGQMSPFYMGSNGYPEFDIFLKGSTEKYLLISVGFFCMKCCKYRGKSNIRIIFFTDRRIVFACHKCRKPGFGLSGFSENISWEDCDFKMWQLDDEI